MQTYSVLSNSLLNNEDRDNYNFKLSVLLGSAIFGVHLSWFVSQYMCPKNSTYNSE